MTLLYSYSLFTSIGNHFRYFKDLKLGLALGSFVIKTYVCQCWVECYSKSLLNVNAQQKQMIDSITDVKHRISEN